MMKPLALGAGRYINLDAISYVDERTDMIHGSLIAAVFWLGPAQASGAPSQTTFTGQHANRLLHWLAENDAGKEKQKE